MKKGNVVAEEVMFSKTIRREIPSGIIYQGRLVTTFRDIPPQAPTHILIVPSILIPTADDVMMEHGQALGYMIAVAAKVTEQEGIVADGCRLVMNTNRHRRQEMYHIHIHLLSRCMLDSMLVHKSL